MEKTIEQLLDTEREKQLDEIYMGLEEGIDVSIYAKSEYGSEQMNKIRLQLLNESTN